MADISIVVVSPYFPPYPIVPGGAEHSLEQMCAVFAEEGWNVRVIVPCYDGRPRLEVINGVEIDRFEGGADLSSGQMQGCQKYFDSDAYSMGCMASIAKAVEDMPCRPVVVANNAQSIVPVSRFCRQNGVPTIGVVRDAQYICEMGACVDGRNPEAAKPCKGIMGAGMCRMRFVKHRESPSLRALPGVFSDGIRTGMRRRRLRFALQNSTEIVSISYALKTMLEKILEFSGKNISVIYNFHTTVEPAPETEIQNFLNGYRLAGKIYFLVAGRKSYGKGTDVAVQALAQVRGKNPGVCLLFAGSGSVGCACDGVVDVGQISQSMLMALLSRSAGLVVPGRCQEGLHRTMVDAVWQGKPIICTVAGGVAEGVKEGFNGYVVPCGDPHAMSAAMDLVLSWGDKQSAQCRTAAADLYEKSFARGILAEKWRRLFGRVTNTQS